MAEKPGDAFRAMDWALKIQGFRRIARDALSESPDLVLAAGSVPPELDAVLRGLVQTTHWADLGHQLALLKRIDHFRDAYLGVSKHRLDLAIVTEAADPLTGRVFADQVAITYNIMGSISELVPKFKLDPDTVEAVSKASASVVTAALPTALPAVSVLEAALRLHEASAGPCGNLVAICRSGLEPSLPRTFSIGYYSIRRRWRRYPSLIGFAWDMNANTLHGKVPWRFQGLGRGALEHQLQFGMEGKTDP